MCESKLRYSSKRDSVAMLVDLAASVACCGVIGGLIAILFIAWVQ